MNRRDFGAHELDLHFAGIPRDDTVVIDDQPGRFAGVRDFIVAGGVLLAVAAIGYGALWLVNVFAAPIIPLDAAPVVLR